MTVGAYQIDFYPDKLQSALRAATTALGVARHTGNSVDVYAAAPSTNPKEKLPSMIHVNPDSDMHLIEPLIQALFDSSD